MRLEFAFGDKENTTKLKGMATVNSKESELPLRYTVIKLVESWNIWRPEA